MNGAVADHETEIPAKLALSSDLVLSRPWFTLPVLRTVGTDPRRLGSNPFVSLSAGGPLSKAGLENGFEKN